MAVLKKKLNTASNRGLCSLFIFMCGFTYAAEGSEASVEAEGTTETVEVATESEGAQQEQVVADPNQEQSTVVSQEQEKEQIGIEVPKESEKLASESAPATEEQEKLKVDQVQKTTEASSIKEPEIGIDTVGLSEPQGNWLFKRIWWERAELKYEKIRKYVESVFESRAVFLTQRADIDKNVLDPLYIAIGFGQGELKRIVDQLMHHLEREKAEKGDLTAQEREILVELQKEEKALQQIKLDVEGIIAMDAQIDESLNTLFEQINRVRGYERDAWKDFKEIARVLSDIKARELYYKMDGVAKNISDIQAYIRQEFSQHFGLLDAKIKEQVSRLQQSIEALKEKGFDLAEQLEKIEKKVVPCEVISTPEPEEIKEDIGFVDQYVVNPISAVFSYIRSGFTSLYLMVMGGNPEPEQEQDEKELSED
ncbi:MAG: hypothetical protein NT124_02035 [Candidatus Dependentiae bacterium]|nr:hypothetical protein [Candidatus Dependentiae bacterium]